MCIRDRHRTRGLFFEETEINLPTHGECFRLVTRIQDEVHRFAITYHHKLREERQLHVAVVEHKARCV